MIDLSVPLLMAVCSHILTAPTVHLTAPFIRFRVISHHTLLYARVGWKTHVLNNRMYQLAQKLFRHIAIFVLVLLTVLASCLSELLGLIEVYISAYLLVFC